MKQEEEEEEILGVLYTVNSAYLEKATAPTAWVWPVPMATQLKWCVVESTFHTRTVASFELETRVSPLVSRHSTIPACPASTWEEEEEEGHGQCRGTGSCAHLAVLAPPVEHLELLTVSGYSQEILTLPHEPHV